MGCPPLPFGFGTQTTNLGTVRDPNDKPAEAE